MNPNNKAGSASPGSNNAAGSPSEASGRPFLWLAGIVATTNGTVCWVLLGLTITNPPVLEAVGLKTVTADIFELKVAVEVGTTNSPPADVVLVRGAKDGLLVVASGAKELLLD